MPFATTKVNMSSTNETPQPIFRMTPNLVSTNLPRMLQTQSNSHAVPLMETQPLMRVPLDVVSHDLYQTLALEANSQPVNMQPLIRSNVVSTNLPKTLEQERKRRTKNTKQ